MVKDKETLLVTGGLGFIGSHVVERMRDRYDIMVVDCDDSPSATERSAEFQHYGVEVHQKDIADPKTWTELPACNYIFHAAAQVSAVVSESDPMRDFQSNAYGTVLVAEYARKCSARVIYCNSIRVYDPDAVETQMKERNKVYEDCPTIEKSHEPWPPFAFSKRIGELYLCYYASKYNFRVISHRMSSIIGPGQKGSKTHGWLSNIIRCACAVKDADKKYTIFGDGHQVRDILHLNDFIDLIEMELQNFDHFADGDFAVYNIGGGQENELSIIKVIEILEEDYGIRLSYKFGKPRTGEPPRYISDIDKIKEKGWHPKNDDPKQTISQLISWHKEREKNGKNN